MLFITYLQYLHISGYKPKQVLCGYIDIHWQNNRNFFSHSVKKFASRLTRKMDFVDFLRLWSTQWKELRPSNEELIMKNQGLLLQLQTLQVLLIQLQTLQQKSRTQKALRFYKDFSGKTTELQAFLQSLHLNQSSISIDEDELLFE